MPRKSIYTETDASSSRKVTKKKGSNITGPAALAGLAGLRRVANAGGFFTRLNNSGIPEMIDRSGDAQRRLEAHDQGRRNARTNAEVRQVQRTGIGRSTPMQVFTGIEEGKKWRKRSSTTFPQGEPSGRRPLRFQSPGNLAQALEAGAEVRRGGRPKTSGPKGSSGGGTGRGGARVGDGVGRGGAIRLGPRRGFGER